MDKKKNSKNIVLFLGSHLSILLIGFVMGVGTNFVAGQGASQNDIIVQMQIDYGEGSLQILPEDIIPSGTALSSYIKLVALRHGIPFDVREIDELSYIEAIHGIHSTQNAPWVYSVVGDKETERNIDVYRLKDGDVIAWSR